MLPTYELQMKLAHEAIVELTQERDAALGRVEMFETLYKVMDASADRYRVLLDEIQDALGWPDCSELSLLGEVKRLKAAESREGGA